MKQCRKMVEPESLTEYRNSQPESTWEDMKNDPLYGGIKAAKEAKVALVRGQRCLCAFCEISIAPNCSDEGINESISKKRVEHFHPKSDTNRPPNWNLHWPNLWAVCHGGSGQSEDDKVSGLYPLPQNLSCDAYKDYQIATGKLSKEPEGWLLAPDEVPAFPPIFQYSPHGVPEPHKTNCDEVSFPGKKYSSSQELVSKTIEHLNLGCYRLAERRRIAKAQLEKRIQTARRASPGARVEDVMLGIVRRLFAADPDSPWPEFFSLLRWRLGECAEDHLRSIGYDG